jgi:hypothetical protein
MKKHFSREAIDLIIGLTQKSFDKRLGCMEGGIEELK